MVGNAEADAVLVAEPHLFNSRQRIAQSMLSFCCSTVVAGVLFVDSATAVIAAIPSLQDLVLFNDDARSFDLADDSLGLIARPSLENGPIAWTISLSSGISDRQAWTCRT